MRDPFLTRRLAEGTEAATTHRGVTGRVIAAVGVPRRRVVAMIAPWPNGGGRGSRRISLSTYPLLLAEGGAAEGVTAVTRGDKVTH